jgi:two-component system chemotaxis sensor kinase CheA
VAVAAAPAQAPVKAEAAPKREAKAGAANGLDAQTLRVSVEKVDQLINLVGELVITQAMLTQKVRDLDPVEHQQVCAGVTDLERNTRHLQDAVMSIRMIPMAVVFNRFPRMIRDLAAKLGKKVELVTSGEATELDKGLIEKITDPLTHLVRNSVDHGCETPDKRALAGKPDVGTVTLSAFHQGGSIVIEVRDDGQGLRRDKILAKAVEKGIPVSDTMTDSEVWQLIFAPGFSTAEQVTDVSGRGVGMDVVKKNITALGGTVELQSEAGKGSRVIVRLPLTLAIMDGMSVAVGDEIYILPLASVVESLQMTQDQIRTIGNAGRVVKVRDEYLPVASLAQIFGAQSNAGSDGGILVVVEADGARTAVLVDELVGQHQVVVKNLESNYRKVGGISGATILGDGRVALILDVIGVAKRARH